MKQLFKLIPVILMVAAISVAGCGDKGGDKKDDKKGGSDTTESKDKGASNTPATSSDTATMVAVNVALPKMDWA